MRVIAGEFKGRKLLSPRGRLVRPTSDRVREALFSLLGDVGGARVLDLYAGSGALGIEALSRGASCATFVDIGPAASVKRNIELIGLEGKATFFKESAERFLKRSAKSGKLWDLVFIDPPYTMAGKVAVKLDDLLPGVLDGGARVVVESSSRQPLKLVLLPVDERVYGDTMVSIYTL